MRTRYRIDDYQQVYFVIDSFEDLLRQTVETDFAPLYERLAGLPDLGPADVIGRGCVRHARHAGLCDGAGWRGVNTHHRSH